MGNNSNFILIGDSHAESLSKSLREILLKNKGNLVTFVQNGCLPIMGLSRIPSDKQCVENKKLFWQFIKTTNATVILSSRWRLNMIGPRFDNQEGGIEHGVSGLNYASDHDADIFDVTLDFLQEMALNNNLIIINQIPEAGWDVPKRVVKIKKFSQEKSEPITTSLDLYKEKNARVIELFSQLSKGENIQILHAETLICGTVIYNRCLNTIGGASLYRDDNHPSPMYADMIAKELEKIINE